jgi:hypothetical protein
MWTFDWGVFWAILLAGAILVALCLAWQAYLRETQALQKATAGTTEVDLLQKLDAIATTLKAILATLGSAKIG